MSSAMRHPAAESLPFDDPSMPSRYVTDGVQLYRLIGSGEPRRGFVWIENCGTLEITVVHSSELRAWDMRPVCPRPVAMAA